VISVENLRQSGWSQDAPASALAAKLIDQTRAFQIYDVRLGARETKADHAHAHAVAAILVSGEVVINGKDQLSKGAADSREWAVIPARAAHRIVNRGTTEAHVVEVEVR